METNQQFSVVILAKIVCVCVCVCVAAVSGCFLINQLLKYTFLQFSMRRHSLKYLEPLIYLSRD